MRQCMLGVGLVAIKCVVCKQMHQYEHNYKQPITFLFSHVPHPFGAL